MSAIHGAQSTADKSAHGRVVKALLDASANAFEHVQGTTVAHEAVETDLHGILQIIFARKGDVNLRRERDSLTLLQVAAKTAFCTDKVITLLLEHRADTEVKDAKGLRPL